MLARTHLPRLFICWMFCYDTCNCSDLIPILLDGSLQLLLQAGQ
jgi:hypothetical protein